MALNNSKQDIVLLRRERVAQLRARGLTQREITAALAKPPDSGGLRNPDTNAPYDLSTINGDIKALRKDWQARAAEITSAHRADQLAEIAQLKREAWLAKKYDLVLRALEREAKLLGTDAPQKNININVPEDVLQALLDRLEAAGMSATDVFNGLIAELDSARTGAPDNRAG